MTSSPEASGVIKDIAIVVSPAPSAPKHCNAVAFHKRALAASWCWAGNCSYSIDMICGLGRKLDQVGLNRSGASRNHSDKGEVKQPQQILQQASDECLLCYEFSQSCRDTVYLMHMCNSMHRTIVPPLGPMHPLTPHQFMSHCHEVEYQLAASLLL